MKAAPLFAVSESSPGLVMSPASHAYMGHIGDMSHVRDVYVGTWRVHARIAVSITIEPAHCFILSCFVFDLARHLSWEDVEKYYVKYYHYNRHVTPPFPNARHIPRKWLCLSS